MPINLHCPIKDPTKGHGADRSLGSYVKETADSLASKITSKRTSWVDVTVHTCTSHGMRPVRDDGPFGMTARGNPVTEQVGPAKSHS